MDVLRTPDECFDDLVDCPYPPRYTCVDGRLRVHHLEDGPEDGPPVVLLHGPPAWSYSWRKVMPIVAAAGYRVLAPDLVGFGRSDKPVVPEKQTAAFHVEWVSSWLADLDLRNVTLVSQGLGTMIGLRVVASHPSRFSALCIAGGYLPAGDRPLGLRFAAWDLFARFSPYYNFGWAVQVGCKRRLSASERAAYEMPFPTTGHSFGARELTRLVPREPDGPEAGDNKRAWSVLVSFEKPVVCAFGSKDTIFEGAAEVIKQRIPGATGRDHTTLEAGHFVQEDAPEELARIIIETAAAGRLARESRSSMDSAATTPAE